MSKIKTKEDKALYEIYRRAFEASTPKGDWDAMFENAELNEFGQKVIPFMDYELEDEVAKQIVADVLKEYKIPKWKHKMFFNTYWLGCSPKSKQSF